jgi:hypothetical protein
MLHTHLANKKARFLAIYINVLCLAASSAATILASGRLAGQGSQTTAVLDLTAEVPPNEQGYYRGIPGMSGGGGAWRPGLNDTMRYQLPLAAEILRASPNKDGNFVIEVLLRNADSAPFELPASRNLTAIEKPGNRSRHVLFFRLQPVGGGAHEGEALGFAATGSSTSIHGSFIALDPGKSMRVLLLASSASIKRSFTQESEKMGVRLTCQEWKLDDNRFFLSGISAELASVNTIQFALRGDQIALVQP